ncbi:hypothetical protein [Amycolatopsis alba]|uniref:Recombinase XerD n=1 Tax=Amycolatopsis alba DSM 44262 TaxID=1125972 RepID=A0A229S6F2_AMYAL|nr:hypothetical protein [Amycolatopsis alba]OXM54470.1 hypothetical protein CFP75_05220 [Amycolatopsis alba DSM 44262]
MSPAYRTPEQRERWHKRTCARCGRFGFFAAVWPDGQVCRTCECRALRVQGRCPECGEHRLLPGLRPADAVAICTGCADFRPSYACSRCGQESQLRAGRLCLRCTLSDQLAALLDDGTGQVRPELVPLHRMLVEMKNPRTGLNWLDGRPPNVGAAAKLLRGLGNGDIELTHEAFHRLQPWRAAAHLRELLMSCGVLPLVDKQICSFERWLRTHLDGISVPDHEKIVRRFITWEVLPRLRNRAAHRPLTPSTRSFASDQVKLATRFLTWLADHERTLELCNQAGIDDWHASHSEHERRSLRGFLIWGMTSKLLRPLRLPAQLITRKAPLPEPERIALLGRLLSGHDLPLRPQVAGVIVLLYAQPLSRIVRLTVDDLTRDGDEALLRLGEPPSPVPAPVTDLLLAWIAQRDNMNTATNPNSRWLFPCRRAGQPMHPRSLGMLVIGLGVPTTTGRTSAIGHHVLTMPAPVVADAVGYHPVTTTKIATRAGTTWNRYAPGDHDRV